jgi:hypothetical protein
MDMKFGDKTVVEACLGVDISRKVIEVPLGQRFEVAYAALTLSRDAGAAASRDGSVPDCLRRECAPAPRQVHGRPCCVRRRVSLGPCPA